VIRDLKIENNNNVGTLLIKSIGKVEGELAINASCLLKKDLEKVFITLRINLAKDKNDKKFEREIFRATFDGEKVLKGITGSSIFKQYAESFLRSLDFKVQFPIKSVSFLLQSLTLMALTHLHFAGQPEHDQFRYFLQSLSISTQQ